MRNLRHQFVYLLLACMVAISAVSCYKDSEELILYNDDPWQNEQKVSLDIIGEVVDEQGEAISDALVLIDGSATRTDVNGIFSFSKVLLNPNLINIRVQKKGYFETNKVISGDKDNLNQVKIVLAKSVAYSGINATIGGEIQLGKVGLNIPANGLVDKGGKLFNGNIRIAARYIDPDEEQNANIIPGDGRAVDTKGNVQTTDSYGILLLEVTDNTGNKLELAEGQEATVVFPKNQDKGSIGINKIPLWTFDKILGVWRENGTFTTEGTNKLVAKLKQFSAINCATATETVQVKGRFTNSFGVSVSNKSIVFVGADGYKSAVVTANAGGYFKITLPKDKKGQFKILDPFCKATLSTQNETSFTQDTDLGNIPLDAVLTSRSIRGNVLDCNSKPLSNGFVELIIKDKSAQRHAVKVFLNADGSYKYDVNITSCIPDIDYVEAQAFDLQNKMQSPLSLVQVTSSHCNMGTISFCNSPSEYIILSLGDSLIYSKQPYCDITNTSIILSSKVDNKALSFQFNPSGNNLQTNYPYPSNFYLLINFFSYLEYPVSQNVTLVFNEVSLKKGDYVSGNISGEMLGVTGNSYKLSGSFRFKKP